MTEQTTLKKAVPPYLPFRTLTTFLEGLKVGMPQRIDRSLMKSMSGTMQSQIMATLEYLRLINHETGVPSENLNQLVHSKGEERQHLLKEILTSSYQFLFKDGLDLENATARQLQESFEQQGVSGDTLRKAVAFFLKAAKEAGLKLSPHFKRSYTRRPSGPRAKRKANLQPEQPGSSGQESIESDSEKVAPPENTLLAKMADRILEKFPDFDTSWSPEQQASWFDGMSNLMAQFDKK
jgi:hypothetical protein